jgi:hypothetical protein
MTQASSRYVQRPLLDYIEVLGRFRFARGRGSPPRRSVTGSAGRRAGQDEALAQSARASLSDASVGGGRLQWTGRTQNCSRGGRRTGRLILHGWRTGVG